MQKKILSCCIFALSAFLLISDCHAEESLSSSDLISKAKDYNEKTVVYEGEVVGEIMARGSHAWLNCNDGSSALGIWAPKDLIGNFFTGNFKTTGDTIRVTGIFNRACAEHGGDLDIHASSITILKSGNKIDHPVTKRTADIALILSIAALTAILLQRKINRQSK